jgi:hypothetical protein
MIDPADYDRASGRASKAGGRRIETQILGSEGPAALLVVIVIFVHDARTIPFPEGAPTHGARLAGYTDEFERPRGMSLVCGISRHHCLSNGYQQTPNFGHYVKWNQEGRDQGAHSRFSPNWFFRSFAFYLDIVGVKFVEDLKKLFEALTDVGLDDGRV